MKPESASKGAFFKINSLILLSFILFFYVNLKHKHDIRLNCFYLSSDKS